jgi:hypothetical protein
MDAANTSGRYTEFVMLETLGYEMSKRDVVNEDIDSMKVGDDPQGVLHRSSRPSGKGGIQFIDVLCTATLVFLLGIAAFVLLNVPSGTRIPFEGIFSGIIDPTHDGIPAPFAALIGPVGVIFYWMSERLPDLPRRKKGKRHSHTTRRFGQILTMFMLVIAGLFMGQMILDEAGYFSAD